MLLVGLRVAKMADEREVGKENSTKKNNSTEMNYRNSKARTRSEKTSADFNSDELGSKRSRRKTKTQPDANNESSKSRRSSGKSEVLSDSVTIKQEFDDGGTSDRLRSLRSRRNDSYLNEPQPGPSIKEEPPDFSDHYENDYDDSDSDPVWVPSTKTAKTAEIPKVGPTPGRKRHSKGRGRPSTSATKRRREKSQESRSKKKNPMKTPAAPHIKQEFPDTSSKGRKDPPGEQDRFLIAKADIKRPTPFLWKVDKKSSMLQRFDKSEQNGVLLYHSSFTYAARNEISLHNYVTAEVRIKAPDTVQYIGPNAAEVAAILENEPENEPEEEPEPPAPKPKPVENNSHVKVPPKENFDHLKEDFAVFVQCLLSQEVDSSFFPEIIKFNDEYFLVPMKNLENVIGTKKKKFVRGMWSEELTKCVEVFPCTSVFTNIADHKGCQVCEINRGNKSLLFGGQPYDSDTLGPVDTSLCNDIQFDVCDKCCSTISLYNRLIHHKYNLFVKCRSKATEIRTISGSSLSHEDVLKLCLEDAPWIEKMFQEQQQIWHDVETNS